jgi:hydroxypyruvate reductase
MNQHKQVKDMSQLRQDAWTVIKESIRAVLPDSAVRDALNKKTIDKEVTVIAIGKAAWNMARAAKDQLGDKVVRGLVVTKYDHSNGPIPGFEIIEAGHPIPDHNAVAGAGKALEMVSGLTEKDMILLLVSGGGSALFEKPLEGLELEDIMDITDQLLSRGADIVEMNTVRKHLSMVKGGRFAEACKGVEIYVAVLSDVIGDHLDVIASGPAFPDTSTSGDAFRILDKYGITVEDHIREAISIETPKVLQHCESVITGSVTKLCEAAASSCEALGYKPLILSASVDCEAKEAGRMLASLAREAVLSSKSAYKPEAPCAFIAGGETVVHLKGKGKGGRNQEVALSAATGIENLDNVLIFSVGSDGTDGPTEAAGGMVDGGTLERVRQSGILPEVYLEMNDSYHALEASGDLIVTHATGTNVNDLMVVLVGRALQG